MKMKQGRASVRLYFRAGPPISHLAERMTRVVALPFVLVALFSGCSGVVPKEMPPVVDLMPSFGSAAVSGMSFPTHTAISDVTLPEASDGDGALSYTFEPVPPGLSFNAADRVLSGTPTTVAVYDVTYRVADEDGDAASLRFTIAVHYGAIFWTDVEPRKIRRSNVDGSGVVDLLTFGEGEPHGITVNGADEKLYWTDCGTDKVQRGNLDGSGVEELVTGLGCPRGIALDAAAGKMYWTEDGWRGVEPAAESQDEGVGHPDAGAPPALRGVQYLRGERAISLSGASLRSGRSARSAGRNTVPRASCPNGERSIGR